MANRPENTIVYEGFRLFKDDFETISKAFDNSKFAHFDSDGGHKRPWICTKVLDNETNSQEGIILKITADGLEVAGEYRKNCSPNIETITQDWKKLLKDWILDCNENWILN